MPRFCNRTPRTRFDAREHVARMFHAYRTVRERPVEVTASTETLEFVQISIFDGSRSAIFSSKHLETDIERLLGKSGFDLVTKPSEPSRSALGRTVSNRWNFPGEQSAIHAASDETRYRSPPISTVNRRATRDARLAVLLRSRRC